MISKSSADKSPFSNLSFSLLPWMRTKITIIDDKTISIKTIRDHFDIVLDS